MLFSYIKECLLMTQLNVYLCCYITHIHYVSLNHPTYVVIHVNFHKFT